MKLTQLVQAHDVVFLLTDSRESRWLPTLLCAQYNKLLVNAALGFDTFVVMRHGVRDSIEVEEKGEKGEDNCKSLQTKNDYLGCYFCSDIVAPSDSLSDRTLDQQCTVTRPGLAFLAAALAVELTVSLLHHPHKGRAAAQMRDDAAENKFGIVPHQLRGFLNQYNVLPLVGHSFENCTACSPNILQEFQARGVEFILDVLKDPDVLEKVSGLTKMKEQAEELAAVWDDDDLDSDEDLL